MPYLRLVQLLSLFALSCLSAGCANWTEVRAEGEYESTLNGRTQSGACDTLRLGWRAGQHDDGTRWWSIHLSPTNYVDTGKAVPSRIDQSTEIYFVEKPGVADAATRPHPDAVACDAWWVPTRPGLYTLPEAATRQALMREVRELDFVKMTGQAYAMHEGDDRLFVVMDLYARRPDTAGTFVINGQIATDELSGLKLRSGRHFLSGHPTYRHVALRKRPWP